MLQCQGIKKSFNQQVVLHDINLSCEAGSIHVLLGKSGSGKSTLLNIMTQLIPADGGLVSIEQTSNHPPIGLVFQQHNLWPHLTVLDNICLAPIKVLKHSKIDVKQKALALLAKFGLSDKANAYPKELSGGQQQRCAIIRCLMMPYNSIALDEPTASLDPQSTQDVANVLIELKNQGMLLIVSTHHLSFAQSIADHVHFMEAGVIVETGTADCLTQPQTNELKHYLNHPGDSNAD